MILAAFLQLRKLKRIIIYFQLYPHPEREEHVGVSVFTPPQPGRRKKGQNGGNHWAYSEKPTSRRKFLRFFNFYGDFLYFPICCYNFLGFPINGHPHVYVTCIFDTQIQRGILGGQGQK